MDSKVINSVAPIYCSHTFLLTAKRYVVNIPHWSFYVLFYALYKYEEYN